MNRLPFSAASLTLAAAFALMAASPSYASLTCDVQVQVTQADAPVADAKVRLVAAYAPATRENHTNHLGLAAFRELRLTRYTAQFTTPDGRTVQSKPFACGADQVFKVNVPL